MEEKRLCCNLNVPYPKICKTDLNRNDAVMIQKLYAAKFCHLNDYIFESFILSDSHKEVSDILDCIAMSELTHFKFYGRLLSAGGYNADYKTLIPFCTKSRKSFGYENNIESFLNYDYITESDSVSDIRLVLSQVYNDTAASVLQRILLDEEHHREILQFLKNRYI